jgi:lipopolysaccharide transport system permease protein
MLVSARRPPAGPVSFLRAGWRNRRLIGQLTRTRLATRYQGTILGFLWLVVLPLLMLGVYTFVFSGIFAARWAHGSRGEGHFALVLFSSLMVYGLFADCVNEAPFLLFSHQAHIKQVLFPIESLGWVSLMTSLVRFGVSGLLLGVFYMLVMGVPPWTAILLPLVLLSLVLYTLGLVWLLASLGVFLRDLGQAIAVVTSALLFISPVFYPASRVTGAWASLYRLNPLVTILEDWRLLLFEGTLPDPLPIVVVTAVGWCVAWLGYAWFVRTQRSFADVL